jgi:hypothetical protein
VAALFGPMENLVFNVRQRMMAKRRQTVQPLTRQAAFINSQ